MRGAVAMAEDNGERHFWRRFGALPWDVAEKQKQAISSALFAFDIAPFEMKMGERRKRARKQGAKPRYSETLAGFAPCFPLKGG